MKVVTPAVNCSQAPIIQNNKEPKKIEGDGENLNSRSGDETSVNGNDDNENDPITDRESHAEDSDDEMKIYESENDEQSNDETTESHLNGDSDSYHATEDANLKDPETVEPVIIDVEKEMKRFTRIIKKIKKKEESRACYQNILAFAVRENKELTMDDCKIIVDEMMTKQLITNSSTDPNMEFFELLPNINDSEVSDSPLQSSSQDKDETMESLMEFLDDKLHATILKMIEREVAITVKYAIDNNLKDHVKETLEKNDEQNANKMDTSKEIEFLRNIISKQNEDIQFLRQEVLSKDEIIKSIIDERLEFSKQIVKSINIPKSTGENTLSERIIDPSKNDKEVNNNDTEKSIIIPKKNNKRTTVILGDSIIKDIEAPKVKGSLTNDEKVYVKCFPGATTDHMKSYVIPTKTFFNNDLIILHCGTNDLRSGKIPKL